MPPDEKTKKSLPASELFALRMLAEDDLLAQCRCEKYRGGGPGGQNRNKISSAVRLTHVPSGLSATGTERRSQAQNRDAALQRLRRKLAFELREAVEIATFTPPPWFSELLAGRRLRIPPRHEKYLAAAGLVLDLLAAAHGAVSDVARLLDISTSQLVGFLQADVKLLAAANDIRSTNALKPLGS